MHIEIYTLRFSIIRNIHEPTYQRVIGRKAFLIQRFAINIPRKIASRMEAIEYTKEL